METSLDAGTTRYQLSEIMPSGGVSGKNGLGPKNASEEQLAMQAKRPGEVSLDTYDFDRLTRIYIHLPFLRSVVEAFSSLIMSSPLRCDNNQDQLTQFLESASISDQSNFSVIGAALEHAFIYGRAGLRMLQDGKGLQFIPANRYCVVYEESAKNPGSYEVVGYVIARHRDSTDPGLYYDRTPGAENKAPTNGVSLPFNIDIVNRVASNDNYVFCPPNEFENFYFFGSEYQIDTPLMHDVDRIELFINLMSVLSQSIENTTSELVLVKLAQDLFNMNTKQIGDIIATAKTSKNKINSNALSQLQSFAGKVSSSTNRETLVVPPIVDQFEQITPIVKISDFTALYDQAEDFVTRLYGLSTNVLNLQKLPRDASSSPIFEQMFKTSVYPKRTIVAYRLSSLLNKAFNTGRVWFAPEEFSAGQRVSRAQNIATVVSTLSNVDTSSVSPEVLAKINNLLTEE